MVAAGLQTPQTKSLPPKNGDGLTVKIWTAQRGANAERRAA